MKTPYLLLLRSLIPSLSILFSTISVAQTMPADTLRLDELVVVGFAQQKKVNLTGSVSQVNMDEVIGDRPLTSVGAALQGAIPGLTVSGSSYPGQPKSLNIRGVVSINGGSPLILIDNVEGDIDSINPEDIESISVLKDAASAAIYGARAAGGVILITTKHPEKNRRFSLDYSFNIGFENCISHPVQASLDDYIAAYREAGFSSQYWAGNGQLDRWQELLGLYRQGTLEGVYPNGIFRDEDGSVYYLKESDVIGNALETGVLNNHNISLSGGTDRISYRLSGNFSHENGPMAGSKDAFTRASLNAFISADVTDWFTQEANIFYTVRRRSEILTTFRSPYTTKLISWYPEGYMPKEIIGTEEDVLIDTPRNACLYQPASSGETSTPRIALKSVFRPLKGWSIIAEYTYQRKDSSFKSYTGQITVADPQLGVKPYPASGQDVYRSDISKDIYSALNVYTSYERSIKDHNLGVMIGYNQESDSYSYINNSVLGQAVTTVPSLQGGNGTKTMKDGISEYSILGVFGRLTYNYKGRYLVELNARYDGSSKFPKVNRFGFFPSVSAGWRLSDEPFMRWMRPAVNNLKFRASYGSIGNQNIAPYGFIASMGVNESNVWLDKGNLVSVITTPGLIRANYTWETVRTFDVGLDFNAFRDRLYLVFDWYSRVTSGMLGDGVELPAVVGASAPLQNVSDMKTNGWELSVGWRDHVGDFGYRIGFNLYDHRSWITKYNNSSNNLNYYYNGKMLGEIWGYEYAGYYTIDDFDADKAKTGVWVLKEGIPMIDGYTVKPGDVKFADFDNNHTINAGSNTLDDPGDRKVIGNSTPRYEFGANIGFSWKGIDLGIMLQGVGKRDCILPTEAVFPFGASDRIEYQFSAVYANQTDYWRAKSYDPESPDYMVAANPDAALPRIYGQLENSVSNRRASDRFIRNASWLRIKNVTLSYSFPQPLLARTKVIQGIRLYASVENLATFSSLPKGYDPEALRWDYPFYRTWSFGAQIKF
ncbi:MAG: SusC/RagA family TonB-linked outer membrane protein [Candidatus Cryptobacteroides sp.]